MEMNCLKEEIKRMIDRLPDEVGYDDIMAEIYFKQRIDKSIEQIEKGETISHEEAKQRLSNMFIII
jgi:hypothetical protein